MKGTIHGPDGRPRCAWCAAAPEFLAYHDKEWGFPVTDDRRLFEKLSLEGFQSGLSWRTILGKRDNFRAAFRQFDFETVARFTEADVRRLLADPGIVRHRGKIEAVINNAQRAVELVREKGSLAAYLWSFEPDSRKSREPQGTAVSAEAEAMSRDLKRRGWKFVGPTTLHSLLQAMGLINDHAAGCVIRPKVEAARKKLRRPVVETPVRSRESDAAVSSERTGAVTSADALTARVAQTFTALGVEFSARRMMGGICFLVADKMCVGTAKGRLMVRFDPARHGEILGRPGASVMDFTGRPMRGYVFVDPSAMSGEAAFKSWLELALAYNPQAKRSKRTPAKAPK